MPATWKGSISFGLVNIPVEVHPAIKEDKVSFKQLRRSDLSPIRQRKVAETDGKEVSEDEIVKGYEVEKGTWITLTDEELETVQIESTHTIEITDFIVADEVSPAFFYKPYLLQADGKGAAKAYALLHRALVETGKIGIAKVAIRNREYLAAIKADGLFMTLDLMRFAAEVLEPTGLRGASEEISAQELAMTTTLIETMGREWEPKRYQDAYNDALKALIERKIKHLPAAAQQPARRKAADTPDILAILQQSIAAGADKRKADKPKSSTRPAKPKAANGKRDTTVATAKN